METIAEAKKELRDNWEKGINCQCCGQLVRLWKQLFHAGEAIWLIAFIQEYDKVGDEWLTWKHVANVRNIQCGDYAKLKFWGLIEPCEYDDEGKKASGKWRPTAKARAFIRNEITIPKYVFTYDTRAVKFSEEELNIVSALGKKFDYGELING